MEKETRVPVVGYIRPDVDFTIPDRHFGLRMALEGEDSEWYSGLIRATTSTLDLGRIEQFARAFPEWPDRVGSLASGSLNAVESIG